MARNRGQAPAFFVNPVTNGTIGRTDQGVDISGSPGAAIVDPVPGQSRVAGRIANWFKGQPFQWFNVISGPFKGRSWYGAEQINFTTNPGDVVSQGQQIGSYAPSGTATEFGWATSSGQTLARATTGYTEGQVTPAGSDFASRVTLSRRNNALGAPNTTVPSYVPKAYISWVKRASQGTGLPASVVAAQIKDESSFDPHSTSSAGAEGIAQFLPGTFKQYGHGSPYNPNDALGAYTNYMSALLTQYNGNIRDALAAYNAGPGNLSAGYGYADNILSKAGLPRTVTAGSASGFGGTRPGGQPVSGGGSTIDTVLQNYEDEVSLPRTAPPAIGKNPFSWWLASFTGQWEKEQHG